MTRAPASIRFNHDNWLCNPLFYRRYWRLQLTNKSIPPPRQCLDKARALRRLAQHFANLVNGRVEVVIDVDKRIRPEPLLQFLPRHHFAGAFQQDGENLKRLAGEFQLHSALAHFSRWKVNFKGSEPD